MSWRLRLPFAYTFRTALLAYVLVPVIVVVFVVGAWALKVLEDQVNERMQLDIELVARAIRLPLSHALEQGSITSIYEALHAAFNIDVVYGAYVYDEDGVEIASSGSAEATVRTVDAARLAAAGDRRGEFSHTGDEMIFSYFVPLTDAGGRINGLLQVTRRGSDFEDFITQVRSVALLAFMLTCLILTALVWFGHHGAIGRHLRKIMRDMTQISVGQTERRLADDAPAEMRVLSQGINDMLDRINASQTELELRRRRELELLSRLQQSEKLAAIGRLASGIAHELGTPLSTVDGKAQQGLRRGDPEAMQQSLQQIRIEASRMEKIIQQLLDFGRRNPLQTVTIDCGTLVRSALQHLEADIAAKQVIIEMPETATLPEDQRPLRLQIDLIRFEQALGNLLSNAVQACSKTVAVCWYLEGGSVVIAIEDDGPGIDAQRLPFIFDPFYTSKPVGEGTGLGLSVAHAAVADHGGRIEAGRSQRLGGAMFRIIMPAPEAQS